MSNKLIYLSFFFILTTITYSQITSGEIVYGISFGAEEVANDKSLDDFRKSIEKSASQLSFKLVFNRNEALFIPVENLVLNSDDFNVSMAKSIFGGDRIFYTDISNRIQTEQKELLGESFLIQTSFDDFSWRLTNESKEISGYQCYMAKGVRKTVGKNFEVNEMDTYAWYCPKIPLSIGPMEAVGLPGLVLEFTLKGHSYVAKVLDFNKEVIISNPQKGKSISQKEYDLMMLKTAQKSTRY